MLQSGENEQAIGEFLKAVTGEDVFATLPELTRSMIMQNGHTLQPMLETFFDPTKFHRDAARSLRVSTLLIKGELSPEISHRIVSRLETCIPNAEIFPVAGASHGLQFESPMNSIRHCGNFSPSIDRRRDRKAMTPLTKQRLPRGFSRWLLRLPALLYEAGLGWLLGDRFLLLTHVGRKSSRPRQTVLEVVHHDPATDKYFIASGWGEKSNWLLNVQKTPMVRVNVGKRHFEAMAKRLSIPQAQSSLLAYARYHPLLFSLLAKLIVGRRLKPTEEDCLVLAQFIPVISLIGLGHRGGGTQRVPGKAQSISHVISSSEKNIYKLPES